MQTKTKILKNNVVKGSGLGALNDFSVIESQTLLKSKL